MNYARRTIGGAILLVICSAVATLACHDIERPLDGPGGIAPVAQRDFGLPQAVLADVN